MAPKTNRSSSIVSSRNPTPSVTNPHPSTGMQGFDNIFDQFKRSFDEMLAPFTPLMSVTNASLAELPSRSAFVDLVDEEDSYWISAELPGFNRDQIQVQVNKDGLIIKAEKKGEKDQKQRNYLHRERAYSSLQRAIAFPDEVNPAKVEASMKDGVLEIRVPKKEPAPEERLTRIMVK